MHSPLSRALYLHELPFSLFFLPKKPEPLEEVEESDLMESVLLGVDKDPPIKSAKSTICCKIINKIIIDFKGNIH